MYEPDRYAPYEELRRAARMAQRYGRVLTVHARACSAASTSYSPPVGGRAHNLRALDEIRFQTGLGVDPIVVEHPKLLPLVTKYAESAEETLRNLTTDDLVSFLNCRIGPSQRRTSGYRRCVSIDLLS